MRSNRHSIDSEACLLTLTGGLRIVYHRVERASVDYFGVVVNAGSRDDPDDAFGLAHFVEHTLFKGTVRRRSWHIINRMEAVGGELNAFTTKESTTVYTIAPAGNLRRSVDLIADLTINSSFPEIEIEKERDVVIDEINSYLDIPAEAVFDDFEDLLFQGSSLGHNILGDARAIERIGSAKCRDYLRRLYVGANMVVFYSGSESAESVCRMVEREFRDLPKSAVSVVRSSPGEVGRFAEQRSLGIHQSHNVVGTRVFDMFDPRRFALSVLTNILGGPGMNSLLNVELRERRGLVYSVDSNVSLLTDTGIFSIYFGCDHDDSVRCQKIVARTIDRLASEPLSPRRLAASLRQYVGQMAVAAENRENMIMSLARQALYRGGLIPRSEVMERIVALTADELRDVASLIASDRLSMLTFC